MGLVHGHWDIEGNSSNVQDEEKIGVGINMGIAIVVPTKKIIDILYLPKFVNLRDRIDIQDADKLKQKVKDAEKNNS